MTPQEETLLITDADILSVGAFPIQPDESAAKSLVTARVNEAKAIVIRSQDDLTAVGQRLIDNKKLQKHFAQVFKWAEIKRDMDAAKKKILDQEHAVMDPLTVEERLYKQAIGDFSEAQRRIAEEQARQERIVRESEERRLFAEAEAARQAEEARINAVLAAEHAEEVERALNSLPADAPVEQVQAICDMPAPEPVHVPLEIPTLAPAVSVAPAYTMPKGIGKTAAKKYRPELSSITQLCAAVASGKVPSTLVDANMANIRKIVSASGPMANIPGIRVVEDRALPSVRV